MEQYQQISILLGGAGSSSAVVSRMLHGQIEALTAKAVKVQVDNGESIWLPKKALKAVTRQERRDTYYELARWLKLSGYQQRFIERHQAIGGQSVA